MPSFSVTSQMYPSASCAIPFTYLISSFNRIRLISFPLRFSFSNPLPKVPTQSTLLDLSKWMSVILFLRIGV